MLLIGCDPEVFIHDKHTGFVNAHGLFPGTKKEPWKVEKGAIQVDGMALEFNIDPASTEDEFNNNIKTVMIQMEEMVKKVNPDFSIKITPVAVFNQEYFVLQDPESKLLGCDPDYDMYGVERTPSDELAYQPVRTAAGHVHLGFTENKNKDDFEHFLTCTKIAQHFSDYPLFVPRTKEEKKRHNFYGGNSPFRNKSYGVELRAPSNSWIAKEGTRRAMYRQLIQGMNELKKDGTYR